MLFNPRLPGAMKSMDYYGLEDNPFNEPLKKHFV